MSIASRDNCLQIFAAVLADTLVVVTMFVACLMSLVSTCFSNPAVAFYITSKLFFNKKFHIFINSI